MGRNSTVFSVQWGYYRFIVSFLISRIEIALSWKRGAVEENLKFWAWKHSKLQSPPPPPSKQPLLLPVSLTIQSTVAAKTRKKRGKNFGCGWHTYGISKLAELHTGCPNKFSWIRIQFGAKSILEQNPFWSKIHFGAKSILEQNPCWIKIYFRSKSILDGAKSILDQIHFRSKYILDTLRAALPIDSRYELCSLIDIHLCAWL